MRKMTELDRRVTSGCMLEMKWEVKERFAKEKNLSNSKARFIIEDASRKWFGKAKNEAKGVSKNELYIYWKNRRLQIDRSGYFIR